MIVTTACSDASWFIVAKVHPYMHTNMGELMGVVSFTHKQRKWFPAA